MSIILLLTIFFPVLMGVMILCSPKKIISDRLLTGVSLGTLLITLLGTVLCALYGKETYVLLFCMTDTIKIAFFVDELSVLFSVLVVFIFLMTAVFSHDYMQNEHKKKRFYGFYLVVVGVLLGLDYAANLVTMYLFFEFMTILSMPLVIHEESHEAIMAALKYMIYSFAGAYCALFGIFFFAQYVTTLEFIPGGSLDFMKASQNEGVLLIATFLIIVGFGVKAGCFPMHAWLPTAHPVAPSPASAVLSGMIVKCGVLAIVRCVFYIIGPKFIAGTWVQYTWIVLSLITIFMGSMLAYREPVLKKRLAYSTVSQLSYILFGLSLLNVTAITGSLIHVVVHAFIKTALFLSAGAFINRTGKNKAGDFTGIGKSMPLTLLSYTFVSLGLIGIPPFSGFISKWYLAMGALEANLSYISYIGPVVLLASALLTAGYLLPVSLDGFLPGQNKEVVSIRKKETLWIVVPLLALAFANLFLGIWPNPLVSFIEGFVSRLI